MIGAISATRPSHSVVSGETGSRSISFGVS